MIIEDESEIDYLNEPLLFRAWHLKHLEFFDHSQCVYWDFNQSEWSRDGCILRLDESSRFHTVCECDHLRSNFFGVLVDVSSQEGAIIAKSILTYIFSSVTCIFLGLAVYILVEYQDDCKRLSKNREINIAIETNKISLAINISIYLLLTHIFVMFGFNLGNRVGWKIYFLNFENILKNKTLKYQFS